MVMQKTSRVAPHLVHRGAGFQDDQRNVPEEVAVAMSYNGTTHAVMMATPADLEDFGVGFSLTEGIITNVSEIEELNIEAYEKGIDVQIRLAEQPNERLAARRRFMAGPVGCGLCGIDSIDQALRPLTALAMDAVSFDARSIVAAMDALGKAQQLNSQTRAVHGAGFYVSGEGLFAAREDVGRHNALDKLIGALARADMSAEDGLVTITSRVSVEMVQKAVILGVPVLAAISAPTALAIRTAEEANLTLVALVRGDEFNIYTHPERIMENDRAS
ncbi:formate dehydrogenase accessory sulfurtransferase FdhD [Falsochrobactrum sp. TDYN1]|uniref:Sulfur carrier protein FdhD n=1 Tax=Falsochrobactrum tianjinense TaxID=2706015 RepID=A0A949PLD5_9HYPH|nr:formate dehydrogenase accessory sulfurtransferase FdhD [Falsochrobactrum sp. TDYN1]MBV2143183.1 formate dehydrogenase accessory sulfurtransferase FdhD [Falsochrobactrum sp. TDYN1]